MSTTQPPRMTAAEQLETASAYSLDLIRAAPDLARWMHDNVGRDQWNEADRDTITDLLATGNVTIRPSGTLDSPATVWLVSIERYAEPDVICGVYSTEPAARTAAKLHYAELKPYEVHTEAPNRIDSWHLSVSIRADGITEPPSLRNIPKVLPAGRSLREPSVSVDEIAVVVRGKPITKWRLYADNLPSKEDGEKLAAAWLDSRRAAIEAEAEPDQRLEALSDFARWAMAAARGGTTLAEVADRARVAFRGPTSAIPSSTVER